MEDFKHINKIFTSNLWTRSTFKKVAGFSRQGSGTRLRTNTDSRKRVYFFETTDIHVISKASGCLIAAVRTSAQHSVPHWRAWSKENQSRIFQNCPVSKWCGHYRWHPNSNPRHINRRLAFICVQKGNRCHQCPSHCWSWLEVCIYIIIILGCAANYQKAANVTVQVYTWLYICLSKQICLQYYFLSIFRFTIADCKFPGSTHDAYILQNSATRHVVIGLQDGGGS